MKRTPTVSLSLVLLWLLPTLATAQLQVSFPVSRMVFQRNTANTATIRVAGYYTIAIGRVEAKVTARDGMGVSSGWQTIQNNTQGSSFAGDLNVPGGWYTLEVRGMNGDQQVGQPFTVERVGVGEVFVIAGQSNAQGFPDPQGNQVQVPGASSDAVSCVNLNLNDQTGDAPFPNFSRIETASTLSPRGYGAWCWGLLGDQLVQRLRVPVLFFNASFAGTSIQNWRESVERGTTNSIFTGIPLPPQQPYANLRATLQSYTAMLGVRAVLWHQGESDNQLNRFSGGQYSGGYYSDGLRFLINRSRQDIGKTVAWMVSRVSYTDVFGENGTIVGAQNQVIASTAAVFAGPSTDNIQRPRSRNGGDDVHFDRFGLAEVANAWNASLTDNFFASATPQSPVAGPTVSVACAGNNAKTITVNGNFASVNWSNGDNGPSLTRGGGFYRAKVKDGSGNVTYTPETRVDGAPILTPGGSAVVCEGSSLVLTSSLDNTVWSNGTNGRTTSVSSAGTYSARYTDITGCEFASNPVTVTVNKLPSAPTLAAEKATTFCQGENTVLASTPANGYIWSNSERNQRIEVRSAGNYSLVITDANGCASPRSNVVSVTVNPLPQRPVVNASRPLTFCADQSVTFTAPEEVGYVWSSGQNSRSITINQPGVFSVRTRNVFNCVSEPSANLNVVVNPLPAPPLITAEGNTTFCEGGQVSLLANNTSKAFWNTGDSTQRIQARQAGNFTARVRDGNGCFSPQSSPIAVFAQPLPRIPAVNQVGTFTLEAAGSQTNSRFQWAANTTPIASTASVIKATLDGTYTARAFIVYSPTLTCFSNVSSPFAYLVDRDNQGLSIYPNPSTDQFVTLETLDDLTDVSVTLYTLAGQHAYTGTTDKTNERKRLDLRGLPAGTYLIQVRSGDFVVTKRLMLGF
jgi:hypothetical protein